MMQQLPTLLEGPAAVLALCRLTPPRPRPALQARHLDEEDVACLQRLRLGPLAHTILREDPAWQQVTTQEQREHLRRVHLAGTVLAVRAHHTAQTVARALDAAPAIPHLFIKGVAAAACLYPDPALRPLSDVDLWVGPADFDRARERLRALGFVEPDATGSARQLQLTHATHLSVDLHAHLRQPERLDLAFEDVYRDHLRIDRLCVPCARDLMLTQAYSLVSSELGQSFNTWVDLRELLLQHPALLQDRSVAERARRAGLAGSLWLILRRLGALFPELDLAGLLHALRPPLARQLALELGTPSAARVLNGTSTPRLAQLVAKTVLLEGWPRRAAFAYAHLRSRMQTGSGQ